MDQIEPARPTGRGVTLVEGAMPSTAGMTPGQIAALDQLQARVAQHFREFAEQLCTFGEQMKRASEVLDEYANGLPISEVVKAIKRAVPGPGYAGTQSTSAKDPDAACPHDDPARRRPELPAPAMRPTTRTDRRDDAA